MWHLFTALACRVFCRSSVGLQAVCSGLGMGEARLGILKGHRGMGGRGEVFEASGVFIRVLF